MWLQHRLCNLLIHCESFVELVQWCSPGLVNSLGSTAAEEHAVFLLLLVLYSLCLHSDSWGRKRDRSILSPSKKLKMHIWETSPFLFLFSLGFFFSFPVIITSAFIYYLNSLFSSWKGKKISRFMFSSVWISAVQLASFVSLSSKEQPSENCQKLIVCFKIWLCSLCIWKVWECKYKSLKPNLKITDLII